MSGDLAPRKLTDLLHELERSNGKSPNPRLEAIGTGFDPLDMAMEGGLRANDLTLVGGRPGVGKTIVTLQWARNMALTGHTVIYACYEHNPNSLLARLLMLELGSLTRESDPIGTSRVRSRIRRLAFGEEMSEDTLHSDPMLAGCYDRLTDYADHLWLIRASGAHTGLPELDAILSRHADGANGAPILFVDYLQKVAVRPEPPDEAEKVTRIATGLKELALAHDAVVVAVVAADTLGLSVPRLRLHHLRGSSALAYEADIVMTLNEKAQAVSKVHLAYDSLKASSFRRFVVFSLEKNRDGPSLLDMEFEKDFEHFRFRPKGAFVSERLVDERMIDE